ncbi:MULTISPECIES: TetR/AcrR family transcriptional regulator [Cryobacterium]|uniref:TetR/AcrR family transcriptional regulator n=2 Tax=Cryobacterium TaxID=69578 RepID=A0ABY2IKP1_9MICO|nr:MULTISPECIES: TetR/AcrR family transcriptional regulator [Cryobacterium]MEB0004804.1 TetR/AcrR family transcriptional regulator [Cryobacterium sp. RTC2.1]TFB97970.1 TetR/AcrR family transcriptional regulator [Cryobacterium sp. MDB2-A-1]TFC09803.1 TetR/AcrR family transcriptional regulator [Cryobacterium sp. MDB2-33-2]TFC10904.1 TetR/AcrR family transcriptional regulator [Cryobacterium sp. MDB2-A-2]TFC14381.1 TetR/AcrR family transcriptional regulator [Cryobacterium sp. MDB2-10]
MSLSGQDDARTRRRGPALEGALLDAAWAELTERGYESFTIDAVATRAGTSRAVLYRRWPGKPELARAAIVHVVAQDPIEVKDTGSLRGDVIALLRQANERRVRIATQLVVSLADYYRATGTSLADLRESISGGQGPIMDGVIARALERGEIDASRLTPRIRNLPVDLFRHEVLMTHSAVPEETILEIVDTIFLPLVLA